MKIFKHRNIMGLIFSVVIAIPFLSVLGRSAYVVVNKNAKDSYFGETINQSKLVNINNVSKLQYDNTYIFDNCVITENLPTPYYGSISNGFLIEIEEIISNGTGFDLTNCNKIAYHGSQDMTKMTTRFYDENGLIGFTYNSFSIKAKYIGNTYTNTELTQINDIMNNNNFIYNIEYNKYSYLDNAFDYSLSRFVDENHFGKINFFEWFTSMFVDVNSNNNALYLHFINWYMNYVMLVSCAYILFLVLMWFINFSRRLLERGMNYDW